MSYTSESDAERAARAEKQAAAIRAQLDQEKARSADLEKKAAKITKRAERGLCPHCKRSFASTRMLAHVKTKHPECVA